MNKYNTTFNWGADKDVLVKYNLGFDDIIIGDTTFKNTYFA